MLYNVLLWDGTDWIPVPKERLRAAHKQIFGRFETKGDGIIRPYAQADIPTIGAVVEDYLRRNKYLKEGAFVCLEPVPE